MSTGPAPPDSSKLGLMLWAGLPKGHYFEYHCGPGKATGWRDQRPSLGVQIRRSEEVGREIWRTVAECPAGGVFLGTHLPDCTAYRTRPGSLPLPRDSYAEALADVVDATVGGDRVRVMLADGWLMVAAEGDSNSPDAEECTTLAQALADRFESRAEQLPAFPEQGSPSPTPSGGLAMVALKHLRPASSAPISDYEEVVVPVQRADLPPGSEAVRVHVRRKFGPEETTSLWIGWPSARPRATVRAGCKPDRIRQEAFLLSDEQLLGRRLAAVLGADLDAVDEVLPQSRAVASRGGVAYTIVRGRDRDDAPDDRVVTAAQTLAAAGPAVFESPALAFLDGRDLGGGVVVDTAALAEKARHFGHGTTASYRCSDFSGVAVDLQVAWATRSRPGGAMVADVWGDPAGVVIIEQDDAEFAALLVPVLQERAAELAPSRWIVTPGLVVAFSFLRTQRITRFWKHPTINIVGPRSHELRNVLDRINELVGGGSM
jgi:hypothetical protein